MTVTLPIRTVSEANAHEHWRRRQRRAKDQRETVGFVIAAWIRRERPPVPAIVTLTRIAPRALDDDNLAGAMKAIRDGVADAFGLTDRDPRLVWRYGQRRGAARAYGVEIVVLPCYAGPGLAKTASDDHGEGPT